ncbi:hypothetical protein [Mariniblastus fucicola]|uniref:Uncharacterized protein n=1 Tax=Mariniblastus fucicola TaxID=980251 RepID=A0A5B9PI55_9BACT|nr:hypothetical protein [Mariniblastus fucicola]QEG24955.1 hypothetical protein MFFC18_48780 [Mariniblastus fucicola]
MSTTTAKPIAQNSFSSRERNAIQNRIAEIRSSWNQQTRQFRAEQASTIQSLLGHMFPGTAAQTAGSGRARVG